MRRASRRPISGAARGPLSYCHAQLVTVAAMLDPSQPDRLFGGDARRRMAAARGIVVGVCRIVDLCTYDPRRAAAVVRAADARADALRTAAAARRRPRPGAVV